MIVDKRVFEELVRAYMGIHDCDRTYAISMILSEGYKDHLATYCAWNGIFGHTEQLYTLSTGIFGE